MPKFFVKIKEVHTATVEVEAENAKEALREAEESHLSDELETHYDYTLDADDWTVFDENGNVIG